jgi:hypothetical protein
MTRNDGPGRDFGVAIEGCFSMTCFVMTCTISSHVAAVIAVRITVETSDVAVRNRDGCCRGHTPHQLATFPRQLLAGDST